MPSGKTHIIELRLRDVSQLFNSMDPAPFHEKDLDHDAEEFIESWAWEYPVKDPVELKVYLDVWPEEDPAEIIQQAIHNYFAYRAQTNVREFKLLMRQAQTSLLIGLVFLAACLLIGSMIVKYAENVGTHFIQEGLTIAGWVAMWRPIQLYLYDWWPVRQQIDVRRKLSRMPIEIVRGSSKQNKATIK